MGGNPCHFSQTFLNFILFLFLFFLFIFIFPSTLTTWLPLLCRTLIGMVHVRETGTQWSRFRKLIKGPEKKRHQIKQPQTRLRTTTPSLLIITPDVREVVHADNPDPKIVVWGQYWTWSGMRSILDLEWSRTLNQLRRSRLLTNPDPRPGHLLHQHQPVHFWTKPGRLFSISFIFIFSTYSRMRTLRCSSMGRVNFMHFPFLS